MKYSLRLRTAKGVSQLPEFDGKETTFVQLLEMVRDLLGAEAPAVHCLQIRAGFPPKEIYGKRDQPVCEVIENRETMVTSEKDPDPLLLPDADNLRDSTIASPPKTNGEGYIIRRQVPSDNSCLFTSIGYVLEGTGRQSALHLRKIISQQLLDKPEEYDEVVLGESPVSYAAWILKDDHWGGSIEISLFSTYYKSQIAVGDIKSGRLDVYGEDKNYKQRVYLLYDGIHYDPLALTYNTALPEDADVTKFDPNDISVADKVRDLCNKEKGLFKFTDTSEFSLRCLVCRQGLKGVEQAQKHAAETNHQQFAEYK